LYKYCIYISTNQGITAKKRGLKTETLNCKEGEKRQPIPQKYLPKMHNIDANIDGNVENTNAIGL
jgi:hypothetical protein